MWIVRLERTCCSFEDTEKMLDELNFFAGVVFLIGLVVGVFIDYSSLFELWFLRITSWFFFRFLLVIIMNNLYFSLLFSLIIFLWLPIKKKKKKNIGGSKDVPLIPLPLVVLGTGVRTPPTSFIFLLHTPFGFLCFRPLAFIGSCQAQWRDCHFFGINGLGIILWIFGIWFQFVWCGLYGWNGLAALLRTLRRCWKS